MKENKKIDLTQVIKEADGTTPYAFGTPRTGRDANGQPIEVLETATFQKLINSSLRQTRIQPGREETKEQYNARALASLALAEKVAGATPTTEFSADEIAVMQDCIAGSPAVVYGQFLRMCE